MQILFLNPVGVLGGAERSLLDVLSSLRQARPAWALHLIAATDGPLLEQAARLGVGTTLLPMPDELVQLGDSALKERGRLRGVLTLARRGLGVGLATRRYARQLAEAVRDLRPDLIHSNGIKCHLLTRLLGMREVPVVWHVRDFLGTRPLMAKALRWASSRAAAAVAISQAVGRDAEAVLRGVPVRVVYNAVDTDHFTPGPGDGRRLDELAALPAAPPGTVRVGLVATFARWKGQDLFLEAAARVDRERPGLPLRFYIVGGPIYRTAGSQFSEDELRARAAALGVGDRVGFLGFRQDPLDVYRALDIVVHASTQPEPFGRTIAEAMACGKPVLAARAGGATELFTEDVDAVGVPPGDAAALAAAVAALAADPPRRQRLGEAARQTAAERFSRERLGRELAALYERTVAV